MKNKVVGIIGGAGPVAGLLMAKKVVETCQRDYGCVNDYDFPKIILLSVPFSEMLKPGSKDQKSEEVAEQLNEALNNLKNNDATSIAIACNTLHEFVDDFARPKGFYSLIEETERYVLENNFSEVLILATTTSRLSNKIYSFSASRWPSLDLQIRIDKIINDVLAGKVNEEVREELAEIVRIYLKNNPSTDAVILGCTELSVLMDGAFYNLSGLEVVDPVEIISKKLCT